MTAVMNGFMILALGMPLEDAYVAKGAQQVKGLASSGISSH